MRRLAVGAAATVGSISWKAPPWARALARTGARASAWAATHRAAAIGGAAALIVVAGGSYGGYHWWRLQPKPVAVTFSVEAPARTAIETENAKPNPLRVKFSRSVAPLAAAGKPVSDGIALVPEIKGIWRWNSDSELSFTPDDDWPVGIRERVELGTGTIAPQIRLASRKFEFDTPAFEIKVARAEFYQDPTTPAQKKAVIDFNFSHPVNAAEFEKRVELRLASQAGGVLGIGRETTPFTVVYDKLKLNASVHSAALPIPKDNSTLTLALAKGARAQRGGSSFDRDLTQAVAVPGIFSLQINEVGATVVTNERNEPEHVLRLTASQSVAEKEIGKAVTAVLLPQHAPDDTEKNPRRMHPWNLDEVTEQILKTGRPLPLELVAGERETSESHAFKLRADVGRWVLVRVTKGVKSFGGYQLGDRYTALIQVPPFPSELKILSRGSILALSGEKKIAVMARDLPGVKIEIGRVLPGRLQQLVTQTNKPFPAPSFTSGLGKDDLTERFERKVPLDGLAHGKAHYEAIDLSTYLSGQPAAGEAGDVAAVPTGSSERRGVFLLTVSGYDPDPGRPKEEGQRIAHGPGADVNPNADEADGEGQAEGDAEAPMRDDTDPSQRIDERLVVVTDLGIFVKRAADGTQDVFVQSIGGGLPVAGAVVEALGRNGLTIASQSTDAQGVAHLPKLDDFVRERAPVMIVVRKGGDLSFLPFGAGRSDRMLDTSRFDVGGAVNAREAAQLSAYLFSDRGLYRPGDTFHVGIVVKPADFGKSIAGLPLVVDITDARGIVARRERIKLGAGGFSEISHTTSEAAATGNYTVNVYIAKDGQPRDLLGSTTLRVQEFLPDRMKISSRLSTENPEGWVHPKDLKALVNVQNLFGTPAENRRVQASLNLQPTYPAFRRYADYRFYDPLRAKDGYQEDLEETKTDEHGDASIDLKLTKYKRATYRATVLVRAFEPEGGRAVATSSSSLVSELSFLVGFKADGDLAFVAKGAKRNASLIAVGAEGKSIEARGLKLQQVERKFVSVLTQQTNGTYKYESKRKDTVLKETPLAIAAVGVTLPLATETPGEFSLVVRGDDDLELNRIDYSVAGKGNVSRSLDRNAELQLTLDAKAYGAGDEIAVSVRAPYKGAGLITIERDRVYAHTWFKADTTASIQKIRVPKDFEGNGYVTVQFVRDIGSDEIFMSPLSHGIVPFAPKLSSRTNALQLQAPELVKPGTAVNIQLSAQQPTRAVVFAVDEGILQVAGYQLGDPLEFFFRKRALEVRTSQILDLLLPEFKRVMAASAPGGDADAGGNKHLNPFKRRRAKPVVYWSGIVEVNGTKQFRYDVPDDFNGTLRVMAVAINDATVGIVQGKVTSRGDFVLSPNVPLAVSPGDTFDVSVGLSNNAKGSGDKAAIAVKLDVPPALEIVGDATQRLTVPEQREAVTTFRLRARSGAQAQPGSAMLAFSAVLDAAAVKPGATAPSAKTQIDVSVRPAGPQYTTLVAGQFNGAIDIDLKRELIDEYGTRDLALSPLPLALTSGLAAYLSTFVHECTEQTVSRTMPAIVLARRPEFAAPAAERTSSRPLTPPAKVIEQTWTRLRERQNADGGLGRWRATVEPDEFASMYALHAMIEARARGFDVPADLLQKTRDYATQLAALPAQSLQASRVRAYAIYLLTRLGTVTTPLVASLRETLQTQYEKSWKDDTSAVYLAATYQLLKQEREAAELIGPAEARLREAFDPKAPYRYVDYDDPLIRDGIALYVIAKHFPARAKALPPANLQRLTQPIANGYYNTLSAAYAVLAIDAYADVVEATGTAQLSATSFDAKGQARALALQGTLLARASIDLAAAKVKLATAPGATAFYTVAESGFDRTPPTTVLSNGLEVVREYLDAKGAVVTKVKVGDEVTVRLRLRAIGRNFIPTAAIVDLLPGGFDVVLQLPGQQVEGKALSTRLAYGAGGWAAQHADVREERVMIYGDLTDSVTEFTYKIRATNVGTFVVPPAYGESLYERTVQARSAAGSITVEAAGEQRAAGK